MECFTEHTWITWIICIAKPLLFALLMYSFSRLCLVSAKVIKSYPHKKFLDLDYKITLHDMREKILTQENLSLKTNEKIQTMENQARQANDRINDLEKKLKNLNQNGPISPSPR